MMKYLQVPFVLCVSQVGIAGRTGSGKSSLFLVLFKMVTTQQGCITIDNQDISTLSLDKLR